MHLNEGKNRVIEKRLVSIHPDGKIEEKKIDNPPSLDDIHNIVGGFIETVPFFSTYEGDPCVAFCNEDGKKDQLPVNPRACEFWLIALGRPFYPDYLVGSIAVVVGPHEFLRGM